MNQKRTDFQGEIEKSMIINSNFSTSVSITEQLGRKISKDIQGLYNTVNQRGLIDIYRTLHA